MRERGQLFLTKFQLINIKLTLHKIPVTFKEANSNLQWRNLADNPFTK